jgi:DNA-binding beta-propeller fold protein YncE
LKARATTALPETEPQRPVWRLVLFFLVFTASIIGIVILTGSLVYNSYKSGPRHDSKAIAAGVTVKPFVTLTTENSFPVGLAVVPNGKSFYLSVFGKGTVSIVDEQGSATAWISSGQLTAPGSLALGPDNALYVVDYKAIDPRSAIGTLKRIAPDGSVATYGTVGSKLPLFAQLAFDGAGNLYLTDPLTAQVWRFDQTGVASRWWSAAAVGQSPALPTGIAYDSTRNAMVIADSGTGTVYRVNIDANGQATNPVVLYRNNDTDIKAVALDDRGRVLMAVWAHDNGQLNRLESDGSVTTLADGFRAPSALIYRDNKVYVANSDLLGLVPPLLFGLIESPVKAKPPFTVDVVDLGKPSSDVF